MAKQIYIPRYDSDGNVTWYTYDNTGNLVVTTAPDNQDVNYNSFSTEFEYSENEECFKRIVTICPQCDESDFVTSVCYDAAGNLVTCPADFTLVEPCKPKCCAEIVESCACVDGVKTDIQYAVFPDSGIKEDWFRNLATGELLAAEPAWVDCCEECEEVCPELNALPKTACTRLRFDGTPASLSLASLQAFTATISFRDPVGCDEVNGLVADFSSQTSVDVISVNGGDTVANIASLLQATYGNYGFQFGHCPQIDRIGQFTQTISIVGPDVPWTLNISSNGSGEDFEVAYGGAGNFTHTQTEGGTTFAMYTTGALDITDCTDCQDA